MPELPEVETVRQVLIKSGIIGETIHDIEIYKPKDETKKRTSLVKEMSEEEFINLLKGKTIHEIDRKEGKLLTPKQKELFEKHNSEEAKVLSFCLGNNQGPTKLTYCDARRFGSLRLQKFEDYKKSEPYQNIGLDLLNDQINPEYLFSCYQKRKVSIKIALLEQDTISGIGNIYASEILFATQIHPLKKTNELTYAEVEKIISATQSILKEALQAKGTSAFDFINPLAQEGSYQHKLKVYGRNKKPCLTCGNLIKKIEKETNNRSTFFCPECQKI
ncbi:1302_t:CDS:2 [Funneliformis geosporum]|uniref:1302_t:CDS:1 n=1 Tax=Funneliformis geosporum TaxID=1117311 RepID=A0A9W4WHB6_9GLOM|nr:1302_t:CDS:2 [Funneliformis geosporum]